MGALVSRCPALKYGMIHVRCFEKERTRALEENNNNFDAIMTLSSFLNEDITWWKLHIRTISAPMNEPVYDLKIFFDASRMSWSVFCEGRRSHGHWNLNDLNLHINSLELMAAFFGLKCFASDKQGSNILLRIDNMTAITYINRETVFESLSSLIRDMAVV